jgi:hypothetical protein
VVKFRLPSEDADACSVPPAESVTEQLSTSEALHVRVVAPPTEAIVGFAVIERLGTVTGIVTFLFGWLTHISAYELLGADGYTVAVPDVAPPVENPEPVHDELHDDGTDHVSVDDWPWSTVEGLAVNVGLHD